MSPLRNRGREAGFALVLTLLLLALLVMAVYALGGLVKVDGQVSSASVYQTQARQNALLGLHAGLSELQSNAGADDRVTGMAGMTGIGPDENNVTRHWCGVWRQSDGALLAWLASGAQNTAVAVQPGLKVIELVGSHTVGAPAADSEHVIAGKIPLVVSEAPGSPGAATVIGSYAWLVSDEGVKTPAYAPGPVPVVAPVIFSRSLTDAQSKLRDAIAAHEANLPKVLMYEQLALLPAPGAALTPSVLQDNFHSVTLTSRFVTATGLQAGLININTNSVDLWRNVLQTYSNAPGAVQFSSAATLSSRGTNLQNGIAAYSGAGKAAYGPFTTVEDLAAFIADAFPSNTSPSAAQIMAVIRPILAVRSDTFRIRGYGEAVNPADSAKVEAVAYCEAVVQRTLDPAANGLGRKFRIIYFRWLGSDDI